MHFGSKRNQCLGGVQKGFLFCFVFVCLFVVTASYSIFFEWPPVYIFIRIMHKCTKPCMRPQNLRQENDSLDYNNTCTYRYETESSLCRFTHMSDQFVKCCVNSYSMPMWDLGINQIFIYIPSQHKIFFLSLSNINTPIFHLNLKPWIIYYAIKHTNFKW